ncbi:hypothetical protein B0H13DRAFT_2058917 [Mycena leptocephala]|nr:hypothetical protein B0H13DRAFT_2058917 [Mycena leptocephala]
MLILHLYFLQSWSGRIERVKYRTITPEGHLSTCSFNILQRAVRSNSKPTSFFKDRVQHLFVEDLEDHELKEILPACNGIQSFVLFQVTGPGILRIPSPVFDRPPDRGDPSQLALPMFAFVTHLDMFDHLEVFNSSPPTDDIITHIALFLSQAAELLARCKTLEALIDMHGSPPGPGYLRSVDDLRFVSMVVSDEDYVIEWIIGTRGGFDFWARADAFIAKKRRGEIHPVCSRCWIEGGDGI